MRVERIVETVPDASNPLGKVTHIVERYHYTKAEIAVMKSRQAFKGASVAAATLLQASLTSPEIAKSAEGTTATCDALAKALIWKIAYLTVKPLEADYFFGLSQPQTIERAEPAPNSVNDDLDEHLDDARSMNEWGRKVSDLEKHGIEDAADQTNLDETRNKQTREPQPGEGVSKALLAEGFECGATDDQGLVHYLHRNEGHEALLHESGQFALKSGWTGAVLAGETVGDLREALAEMDQ